MPFSTVRKGGFAAPQRQRVGVNVSQEYYGTDIEQLGMNNLKTSIIKGLHEK